MTNNNAQSNPQQEDQANPFIPISKEMVASNIPVRPNDSYKGDYGRVLCIGGRAEMAGAISLAASAALYSGAGLVTVATDPKNFQTVHQTALEVMCLDWTDKDQVRQTLQASDTILIGPGLGRNQHAQDLLDLVLSHTNDQQNLVIDADGLYLLSQYDVSQIKLPEKTILTPHPGEWKNLTSLDLASSSWQESSDWQKKIGALLVLKQSRTQVYTNDQVYQNTAGNPAMAVGGMGDTLAGIITGLLGQYPDFETACLTGVFIHSYIADQLATRSYLVLPSSIIPEIPACMKAFVQVKQGQDQVE